MAGNTPAGSDNRRHAPTTETAPTTPKSAARPHRSPARPLLPDAPLRAVLRRGRGQRRSELNPHVIDRGRVARWRRVDAVTAPRGAHGLLAPTPRVLGARRCFQATGRGDGVTVA